MTQFFKWKMIGCAAVIFIAGAISGSAFGVYQSKKDIFAAPHKNELALRIRTRLQSRLDLTEEQMLKIDPVIEMAAANLSAVRMDTMQDMGKVFEHSYAQISMLLTPAQRAELERMQRERQWKIQQTMGRSRDARSHGGPDQS